MRNFLSVLLLALVTLYCTPAQAAFRKSTHIHQSAAANTSASISNLANSPAMDYFRKSAVHSAVLPGKSKHPGWEGTVAFICGILGLVLIIPAIPAVIFGHRGRYQPRHRTLATIGAVLGTITILAVIIAVLLASFFSYNAFDFLGLW